MFTIVNPIGPWLIPIGAGVVVLWGFGHILPWREVVNGFGPLSPMNRRIVEMEWVAEGLALIFIGALALAVWAVAPAGYLVSDVVLALCAGALAVLALWTAIIGYATGMIFIRLCPLVLTAAAVAILFGAFR